MSQENVELARTIYDRLIRLGEPPWASPSSGMASARIGSIR
jgi:hypothetical protein